MTAHTRRVQSGSGSATPTSSQTIVQSNAGLSVPLATLRLRAAEPASDQRRRIRWAEDVVDNEGMGKKKSKVCCIYHKPHEPGDSDGDSDSDSSSSSDEGSDNEDLSRAQRAGGSKGKGGRRKECGDGHGGGDGEDCSKGKPRKASPNAYERQPKPRGKKEE